MKANSATRNHVQNIATSEVKKESKLDKSKSFGNFKGIVPPHIFKSGVQKISNRIDSLNSKIKEYETKQHTLKVQLNNSLGNKQIEKELQSVSSKLEKALERVNKLSEKLTEKQGNFNQDNKFRQERQENINNLSVDSSEIEIEDSNENQSIKKKDSQTDLDNTNLTPLGRFSSQMGTPPSPSIKISEENEYLNDDDKKI